MEDPRPGFRQRRKPTAKQLRKAAELEAQEEYTFIGRGGYNYAHIFDSKNRPRDVRIDFMVAKAWVPNDDPIRKKNIKHLDGDLRNDRADNLKWVA